MLHVNDTEKIILDAAQKVFTIKGFSGATMDDISKEANVNKAALHYYYRSKEKLFELVFQKNYHVILDKSRNILETTDNIEEIIKKLNNMYFDTLSEHPYLANCILNEYTTNSDRVLGLITSNGSVNFSILRLLALVRVKIFKGETDFEYSLNLMLNIISVNIFPFLIRPILINLFKMNDVRFISIMNNRKIYLTDFLSKHLQ